MSDGDQLHIFQNEEIEKIALTAIGELWKSDEFWPVKEFYISLKIPGTFLVYWGTKAQWKGLALGREGGGAAELFYIFVAPCWRGQGLGQKLLKFFEVKAYELYGAKSVFLEVRPTNQTAWRLYESLGYLRIGKRARYYPDGEEAWIYERNWEALPQ